MTCLNLWYIVEEVHNNLIALFGLSFSAYNLDVVVDTISLILLEEISFYSALCHDLKLM